jgi:16S rRNA (cytidine1402-2'-O)-methyltransferase
VKQGIATVGTLYVVATPIGNLEDMTVRAKRVLAEVNLIAAEDTRHTGKLLKRLEIKRPLLSYHSFNERFRLDKLIEALDNGTVALVTDSGTPTISDPGAILVRTALEQGHEVVPIPGPSALTAAVSASGLVNGPFTFLGFLPRKEGERRAAMSQALRSGLPLVIFESPNRVSNTMAEIAQLDESRQAAVFRELTKLHESVIRGRVQSVARQLVNIRARGEFVIVLGEGKRARFEIDSARMLRQRVEAGDSPSVAAREISRLTGTPRSQLYRLALELTAKNSAEKSGQGS